jgi:23S rRNA pseudouridine1911/1915/1917 synthase
MIYDFIVPVEFNNTRLDKFLAQSLDRISRSKIKKIIEQDGVDVNNKKISDCSYLIKSGDVIKIAVIESKNQSIQGKAIPFAVVYEDEYLLVVNKPSGLTVHPGAGNYDHTLVNALIDYCGDDLSNIAGDARPGIVHRLDKDTSGLMIVAKNNTAHAKLSEQLANREISRTYHTLIYGILLPPWGTIKTQVRKSKTNPKKMSILYEGGKTAITHYKALNTFKEQVTLLECKLETGRTHQIRLHLEYKKHPIIGDQTYGKGLNFPLNNFSDETRDLIKAFPRQALHAVRIAFVHPITEDMMEFNCEYPEDFKALLNAIKS